MISSIIKWWWLPGFQAGYPTWSEFYLVFVLKMSRFFYIKELQAALKTEKSSNIIKLHHSIFGNYVDKENRHWTREFTGFPLKTEIYVYEETISEIKGDFSVNDKITICNVLFIDNASTLDDLTNRIISNFCDLSVLKSNIIHKDNDNSDNETNWN